MKRPDAVDFLVRVYTEPAVDAADLQGLITLQETERDTSRRSCGKGGGARAGTSGCAFVVNAERAVGAYTRRVWKRQRTGKARPGRCERTLFHAACEAIDRGRQAIVSIVPETPWPRRQYKFARFPGETGLLHSKLSEGERYDTWRRACRPAEGHHRAAQRAVSRRCRMWGSSFWMSATTRPTIRRSRRSTTR